MDIKNLKEVLAFGLELGSAVYKSKMDDGKIDLGDLPKFLPAISLIPAALANISDVPAELKDLDLNEVEEIKALIAEKLAGIEGLDEKWLVYANAALKIAQGVIEFVAQAKA
jgi:hypothetical protein